ncbi:MULTISPECIES: SMP-30/gluconolactonase/LRE family protein [Streptomyces]|uniref:Twin-arginine translocation signal domain-containing protein n=1 Tax=Streptomyces solicathayae TaxID=3081768 RepID=A0ABZ0M0S9_9ACTN|nr:twin-arginine translocation signal domain-containing protein [Streptomyces sp. HUAS YS2]WOX25342.1 twin-arginine translocation signal domain-containing protein [Streptomyces sp. HUAS YS2]
MQHHLARRGFLGAAAALGAAALTGPLTSGPAHAAGAGGPWPTAFPLPRGFQPEGVAIGHSPYAYFGSLGDGSVYRVALATGEGRIVHQGLGAEKSTVGLKIDRAERRLFLAGGWSREIRVVDARSGALLRHFTGLGADTTMVNDVVLTPGAAWFTDSFQPQLYRLALDRTGEPGHEVTTVPLGGDWVQGADFTANGIERTPDGRALLVVNCVKDGGSLMRVDARTGTARTVDLGDLRIPAGDGLLLLGRDLYIVQQQKNQIDVVRLDAAGTRGTAIARITDPDRFRVPTTAAVWGDRIYLPNARFGLDEDPTAVDYDAVSVPRVQAP